ncbi:MULTISPECIES: hypothetical protein [Paraburkholderia]|jgi:hypothetical protein|uniref:Uncharacterized protein n=1 Tax=Paraburkholderia terricola TaxID=169427 RepID=A0A1M6VMN3_9BURK|nr:MULTISPECIES: hypothetical protein [Paraburkholderia]AXE94722.1 hypothetical protein CUJ90_20230 [Paraburkholderia terricola]ORC45926.1 hypothetical protein B2G74_28730 [Burkholderia sp. A27]SDP08336.1 hypothetical protein SAMN05192547_104062 [Paraburkholderia sediminicola]SHK82516.1 hypothetical protein SAMN05192548_104010 [Paraburkholderia terricola]
MKHSNGQSLRCQVEKWLAPTTTTVVHVTRFSRTGKHGRRYVCVEARSPAGARALFFFRHDDGNWCVFPPTASERKSTARDPLAQTTVATC